MAAVTYFQSLAEFGGMMLRVVCYEASVALYLFGEKDLESCVASLHQELQP